MDIKELAKRYFQKMTVLQPFGENTQYVPGVYARLVAENKDEAFNILDRLEFISIRRIFQTKNNSENDEEAQFGKILRMSGAEVESQVPKFCQAMKEFLDRKKFYIHMLRSIAGDNIAKQGLPESGTMKIKVGNVIEAVYDIDNPLTSAYTFSVTERIEGGILENWATDMVDMDVKNVYTRSRPYLWRVKNPLATSLIICWNLTTDNQLRREYLKGDDEDTQNSADTAEFKQKMCDFYRALCLEKPEATLEDYDAQAIAKKYADLIIMCDTRFNASAHSDYEKEKYTMCMKYIKSGFPIFVELQDNLEPENMARLSSIRADTLQALRALIPAPQHLIDILKLYREHKFTSKIKGRDSLELMSNKKIKPISTRNQIGKRYSAYIK